MDLHGQLLVGFDGAHHCRLRGEGSSHLGWPVDRGVVRPHRGFHPRPPRSHRRQQLCLQLQEPGVAERGDDEEAGASRAREGGQRDPDGQQRHAQKWERCGGG